MGKVNKENFYVVHGWMLTDMDMKGNEIAVYSIIYGFTQDGESTFKGGLQYLAEWTKTSKRGVMKNLQSLEKKGYIEKIENVINGVKFCEYRVTKFSGGEHSSLGGEHSSLGGDELSSLGGGEHSSPNNININNIKEHNIENNINKGASACGSELSGNDTVSIPYLYRMDSKEIEKDKPKEKAYYPLDEKLNKAFADYVENRKKIKKPMTDIAIDRAIKKLDSLTNDPDEKIEILNQSIICRWTGLYPLKKEHTSSGSAYIDAINNRMQVVDDWLKEYGNND